LAAGWAGGTGRGLAGDIEGVARGRDGCVLKFGDVFITVGDVFPILGDDIGFRCS
jgi:hypothetical protein